MSIDRSTPICPKHPTKPRRWKRVHVEGRSTYVSVCSVCSPMRGRETCVNGHFGKRSRDSRGVLICDECRRATSRRWKAARRAKEKESA